MTTNEEKNLSERLRFALEALGVSQTELAKRINVKPQIIQYLCAGKAEKSKFTFDIAEVLKIDVSWLAMGKGVAPSTSELKENKNTIPILTFSQIKKQEIDKKDLESEKMISRVPINNDIHTRSFAFVLNDKSMAPRFDLRTMIIIDPTIDPYTTHHNNRFVLTYLANEDFLVFRQLDIATNGVIKLIPLNNNLYKDIVLNEKDIILGVCKEARWNS